MSNMEQPQNEKTIQPKIDTQKIKSELADVMSASLSRSAEAVTGDSSSDPLVVFSNQRPAERRGDAVFEEIVVDEEGFRGAMAELGPGRMEDLTPEQAGLTEGYVAIHESGQSHKLVSQLQLMLESMREGSVKPSAVVIAASVDRKLPLKEREQTAKLLGIDIDEVGNNEYEVSRQVMRSFGAYLVEGTQSDTGLRVNASGETVGQDEAGSVSMHHDGSIDGVAVMFMAIGREYNEDGTYAQLRNQGKMNVISEALGDGNNAQIGFFTSATYEPGNKVEALLSKLKTGREAKVVTYGVNRLAAVKGQEPTQPSLSQLAAEAYKTAKLVERLRKK